MDSCCQSTLPYLVAFITRHDPFLPWEQVPSLLMHFGRLTSKLKAIIVPVQMLNLLTNSDVPSQI